MDTSLSEESISEVIAKQSVSTVNISIMDQCDQMSLEDKKTDVFLDEVYKKKIRSQRDQRPQILNLITQPYNSISSEASANSDGREVPSKEKIGGEQNSKCKKGKSVNKFTKQELFALELFLQEPSIEQNHVTKISETLCHRKVISDNSSIDEAHNI
ncbi:hypothetical protein RhiirC2_779315 [Rhizophagus irregularis]|uniref:Uncharacterized protein n=1 Tax=Rhizophagus irregularis TaxID=588596 RepID=A0A2N1N9Y9_9GLOM|nr:hypothetical protein RhiirC2_779315 [Rhizophagus irregularis]